MPHAIRIHATGGPEQLRYEAVPELAPGRGQLLLRNTAVGVNFLDVYQRTGLYPLPALPAVPGSESVGVVQAVGADVAGFQPGDRVGCVRSAALGAYAEQRLIDADQAIPLPAWLDDVRAAALLLKGLTAEYLVQRTFRVGREHRVLVHAAAGGTGLLLCQWLRHLGAEVWGTVSTAAKAELARAHGCTHPIVTASDDFVATVRADTKGAGVHVVYDSVGKATLRGSLDCLCRRGMLVAFGNSSGRPEPVDPFDLLRRGSLFLTRPSLHDYIGTHGELLAASEAVLEHAGAGILRVHLDRTLPLRDAAAAHRALEGRQTAGAIVLTV